MLTIYKQINNSPKQKKKPLFISINWFVAFEIDDVFDTKTTENTETWIEQEIRIPLSLPIIVRELTDFVCVWFNLIDLLGLDNFAVKSIIKSLKILSYNPSLYQTIINYLKDNKSEFQTYQLQDEKFVRTLMRNLRPITNTAEIIKVIN